MGKEEKIKVPSSVKSLTMTKKKFAKKNEISLKAKGKGDKKRVAKQYKEARSVSDAKGVNLAVRILAEKSPDAKGMNKVHDGVEAVITDPKRMKKIAKLHKADPSEYPHLVYLPSMIVKTIEYYSRDSISADEIAIRDAMDTEELLIFCEKILKKQIKHYKRNGFNSNVAFQLACAAPSSRQFKNNHWYKTFINTLYATAVSYELDLEAIIAAVVKVDKKSITKKEFKLKLCQSFIMQRLSNKNIQFTDTQKDLHESLIADSLEFINSLKPKLCREVFKTYIKSRKKAESFKNDGKRVIKFMDLANSNSKYATIKSTILELIKDDPENELYLN